MSEGLHTEQLHESVQDYDVAYMMSNVKSYIDSLAQDCGNAVGNVLGLEQSCAEQSTGSGYHYQSRSNATIISPCTCTQKQHMSPTFNEY